MGTVNQKREYKHLQNEGIIITFQQHSRFGIKNSQLFIHSNQRQKVNMNNKLDNFSGLDKNILAGNKIKSEYYNSAPALVSKIISLVVVGSIIFLPIVGFFGENMRGIDVIDAQINIVREDIKVFLILSITCGVFILFLREYVLSGVTATIGLMCFLLSFLISKNSPWGDAIELRIGSYLAFIGFSAIVFIDFANYSKQNNIDIIQSSGDSLKGKSTMKKNNNPNEIFDTQPLPAKIWQNEPEINTNVPLPKPSAEFEAISKLRQLKQLFDEGVLSQEEFDQQKNKILNG